MIKPTAFTRIIGAGAAAILLLMGHPAAQTAGALAPVPVQTFLDPNTGLAVASGKVCTYAAGTTTPQATYSDAGLSVANPNPILLSSTGVPTNASVVIPIYLSGANYKVVLLTAGTDNTCATGTTVWTKDNVEDIGQVFLAQTRTANTVFAGPSTGAAAVPTFRALVLADLGSTIYETGTWTPVIGGSGGTTGQSYTRQVGLYTRIGNLVHVQANVALSAKGTITGSVQIQGLPFASNATSSNFSKLNLEWFNTTTSYVAMSAEVGASASVAGVFAATAAATSLATIATADVSNTTAFIIEGSYLTP